MLKKLSLLACLAALAVLGSSETQAQAVPTATKAADLQVGGTYVYDHSDYAFQHFQGLGIYSSFDIRQHFGVEVDFHQANGKYSQYERTYEVGGRYVLHYGRLHPFLRLSYGRGVYNFPPYPNDPKGGASANIAYNLAAIAGGADYNLRRSINLRAEFEYQQWGSDQYLLRNGISPYLINVGAAYHFH